MRIVFMGTPEYAVQSLKALVEADFNVVAVFTQPDKPKGRGGKLQMPPAKLYAMQQGIAVYQPSKIRLDSVHDFKELQPDVCITAAFGQILSKELLDIPRLGTVNVHASLLPGYRGSSPINWCLINGENETGVSTMLTNVGIDTGDILLQKQLEILAGETAGELTHRLGALGAELLIETLNGLSAGTIIPRQQDEEKSSYYPMLKKEMGLVDWSETAVSIVNLIRGLNPWPTAHTDTKYGRLKLLKAQAEQSAEHTPGTIIEADPKKGLLIQTGAGAVRLHLLQGEGGKAMKSSDYLRGHPMQTGERL